MAARRRMKGGVQICACVFVSPTEKSLSSRSSACFFPQIAAKRRAAFHLAETRNNGGGRDEREMRASDTHTGRKI
jgi:hypothetical protein